MGWGWRSYASPNAAGLGRSSVTEGQRGRRRSRARRRCEGAHPAPSRGMAACDREEAWLRERRDPQEASAKGEGGRGGGDGHRRQQAEVEELPRAAPRARDGARDHEGEHHLEVIKRSSRGHQEVIRESSGSHQGVIREVIRESSDAITRASTTWRSGEIRGDQGSSGELMGAHGRSRGRAPPPGGWRRCAAASIGRCAARASSLRRRGCISNVSPMHLRR